MSEPTPDLKTHLQRYLQHAREAVVWKLEGLSEYDVRRPMTASGTNLLGLVKHLAGVDAGYLGDTFGRPFPEPLPWLDDGAEPNADMWAEEHESREDVLGHYHRAWAHGDETVAALDLGAVGHVPWWRPGSQEVTLGQILVHLVSETDRHAGHADVVRELIDDSIGMRAGNENLPTGRRRRLVGGLPAARRGRRSVGRAKPPGLELGVAAHRDPADPAEPVGRFVLQRPREVAVDDDRVAACHRRQPSGHVDDGPVDVAEPLDDAPTRQADPQAGHALGVGLPRQERQRGVGARRRGRGR